MIKDKIRKTTKETTYSWGSERRAHRNKVNGVLGDFSGTELVKWSLAANQGGSRQVSAQTPLLLSKIKISED